MMLPTELNCQYQPLQPLDVIDGEIRALEAEIQGMLAEVMG